MKPIILLFKPHRACLSRCLSLLLLVAGLLLAGQVRAQIYSADYTTKGLNYFDLTTGAWIYKGTTPNTLYGIAAYQEKIYGIGYTNSFQVYDLATLNWTAKQAPGLSSGNLVTAGNYIYANGGYSFKRYDPVTDSWTALASIPSSVGAASRQLTYDGSNYIYCGFSQGSKALAFYDISKDTWTVMPTPPIEAPGVAFANGKLYILGRTTVGLYVYDPSAKTYTKLATPPSGGWQIIKGDGNYLYSNKDLTSGAATNMYRYDIATDTWTTLPVGVTYSMLYMGSTCTPTASVTATQATCASGGGVNTNAALTLSSYGGGVTKVGYSAGSSYTGPDFSAATALTTAPMTLANTLTNPSSVQPYTIRVFQDATCYKDVVVTLEPKVCLTADLSLAVSPPTQTGAQGEQLNYTFTLTNAGPDVAPEVTVDIPIPKNTQFLSATASQGSYSAGTAVWTVGTVSVGSQTITLTLQLK